MDGMDASPSETEISDLPGGIIAQVLGFLEPKELARVAGVCQLWRCLAATDAAANRTWRKFYQARWKVTDSENSGVAWHIAYGTKLQAAKSWGGKNRPDWLQGHKGAVRCCKLLPKHNLMATGSVDKTVRLWDLATCMPLCVSKPHGGTVRCLALDRAALATGCSDHLVRVWLAKPEDACEDKTSGETPVLFDVASNPDFVLRDHTGPVSAMCLTEGHLWTGSWDYSVRVWSRASAPGQPWQCTSVLTFDDWIGALAVRGPHLMVAAGRVVSVMDSQTGQTVRKFQDLHEGQVSCLEGSQNGRLLFTGSDDGLVLVHDLRMRQGSHVLWQHTAGVQGLAFEDPWLATASADGTVALINTEGCMRESPTTAHTTWASLAPCISSRHTSCSSLGAVDATAAAARRGARPAPRTRQFQTSFPAYCVDLADQWLAAGSESNDVRVWDFTKAAEAAERAAAARAARYAAKNGGANGNGATGRRRGRRGRRAASDDAGKSGGAPSAAILGTSPPSDGSVGHLRSAPKAGRKNDDTHSHAHRTVQPYPAYPPPAPTTHTYAHTQAGPSTAVLMVSPRTSMGFYPAATGWEGAGHIGQCSWAMEVGTEYREGQAGPSGSMTQWVGGGQGGAMAGTTWAPRPAASQSRRARPPRPPQSAAAGGAGQDAAARGAMMVLGAPSEGFTYRQIPRGRHGKRQ